VQGGLDGWNVRAHKKRKRVGALDRLVIVWSMRSRSLKVFGAQTERRGGRRGPQGARTATRCVLKGAGSQDGKGFLTPLLLHRAPVLDRNLCPPRNAMSPVAPLSL